LQLWQASSWQAFYELVGISEGTAAARTSETWSQAAVRLRQNAELSRAYLRAAQAYMLISMPTDTSTIFGVFQAITSSPFGTGRFSPVDHT